MRFTLIDYATPFYKAPSGGLMPQIRSGKFIQVRHMEEEYLIMSVKDLTAYHANIAERFFAELKLKGCFNEKG